MALSPASARVGKRFGQAAAGVFLFALFALLMPWQAASARARGDTDSYSATVKLDATADNPVDARRMARLDGERRALLQVIEQVSGISDVQLPQLDDNTVTDMVESFEVAHERMSTVRYLADYTFHFYPDKVRRLLRKIDLTAAATGGRIIVLPVYQDGAQAMLWDDPNPWREAWSERPSDSGPIRLIVPLGDVGDLAAIDAERAEAGRPDALKAVARRNGGGAVVVAVAKLQRSDDQLTGVNVKLSEYRDGRLVGRGGKSIAADPGEDQAALLRRAVAAAADAIAGLKPVAAGASAPPSADAAGKGEGSIAAVVPIASLDDWIAVRRRLVSVPTIRGIELLSLSREEARIRLHYIGSPDRLKTDLAAVDLALDGGDPVWRVHPAGASDPP